MPSADASTASFLCSSVLVLVELESYYELCCAGAQNSGTSVTSLLVKRKLTRGEGGEGSRANVEDADRQDALFHHIYTIITCARMFLIFLQQLYLGCLAFGFQIVQIS